jgi:hypothetical protein
LPVINRYVLDSCALIGYLEDEPFAEKIAKLFLEARDKNIILFLHTLHIGEMYYIILCEQGQSLADLAYARIKSIPLCFIDVIDE